VAGIDVASIDWSKYEPLVAQWRKVIIFYCLRLLVAPAIESLILVDRVLYLAECGYDASLTPIFDPILSPRNVAIVACKK